MRRAELDRAAARRSSGKPIPEWLLAMPRAALEAMLEVMREAWPSLGFAHRNLTDDHGRRPAHDDPGRAVGDGEEAVTARERGLRAARRAARD